MTHRFKPQLAQIVEYLAGAGGTVEGIANAVRMSTPTLRKHYRPALEAGQDAARTAGVAPKPGPRGGRHAWSGDRG